MIDRDNIQVQGFLLPVLGPTYFSRRGTNDKTALNRIGPLEQFGFADKSLTEDRQTLIIPAQLEIGARNPIWRLKPRFS